MTYLSGFRNTHSTEEEKGLLPLEQNSPQVCPGGLFAEQISGSAFTRPRHENLRSWLYRRTPSVSQGRYELDTALSERFHAVKAQHEPNQTRWQPLDIQKKKHHFVEGLCPLLTNGNLNSVGSNIYLYSANISMQQTSFHSSDGEFLIVAQSGDLEIRSEFGLLQITPGEIAVIPRGIHFQVNVSSDVRGYAIENFGAPFNLPDLGPIGANGLANPRHFLAPVAASEKDQSYTCYHKYQNQIYTVRQEQSPFNVKAWWGNYYPYKYDLKLFNTVNTVSFDHPDPSIFTVLTSPSLASGVANIDFVIFPERWMVAEHTFRPPYYHRNIMSEYMGLIYGSYDAKDSDGFKPGGGSLHNQMSPHGPDLQSFEKASKQALKPERYESTLAFMFESSLPYKVMPYGDKQLTRDENYKTCWQF